MEFLSWLFFCLSPFALFCSESGTGLILCPVFIILGFLFKLGARSSEGSPTATVKVEPQKFWEWHYENRMKNTLANKDSIDDKSMALNDKEARDWATTICGYHNAWVPPKEKQEQIARANGVVTEKMVKGKVENEDRIQIGKYFLMRELQLKYEKININAGKLIGDDIRRIRLSDGGWADEHWANRKYGKTVKETWETLSQGEKEQAQRWVKEYEEKLVQAIEKYGDYVRVATVRIKMED